MKIRKAILTGGGRATRLHPITTTTNKHLLPLANKPMIFHAIDKAVEAGVREIFINTNPGETELQKYIGDGGYWGVSIKFFEQEGGPQGIAHVVKCAEDYIGNDPFMFFLSDNIVLGSLKPTFEHFVQEKLDCMLAFAKVPDARPFGVPIFDDSGKLVDVWEKPDNPPNNLAQTGIYLYGPKVFYKAFDQIEKSARGEYEISSIHSHFLKNGFKVGHKEVTGWWKDTGMPEDMITANQLLLEEIPAEDFSNYGKINSGTEVQGKVQIGIGSLLKNNVKIIGPVIVGENCILENCTIGPYTTIGSGSEIRNAKIKNSIVLENSLIHVDMEIDNSIIGKSVKLVHREKKEAEGHRMIIGDKTVLEI